MFFLFFPLVKNTIETFSSGLVWSSWNISDAKNLETVIVVTGSGKHYI